MKRAALAPAAAFLAAQRGWETDGACVSHGRGFLELLDVDEALAVCAGCPVQRPCLAHAITTRATDVIQAGIVIEGRPIHPRTWEQT